MLQEAETRAYSTSLPDGIYQALCTYGASVEPNFCNVFNLSISCHTEDFFAHPNVHNVPSLSN